MLYQDAIKLFKEKLKEFYGDRLFDVILYGSYARGEQEEGSDIDIIVLLKNISDYWKEVHCVEEISYEVNEYFDWSVFISAFPEDVEVFNNKNIPLFLNIKREGILL
ncbi:MAG: nucleotidyltransferase domain-containing protein [Spirochaetota bacterium]